MHVATADVDGPRRAIEEEVFELGDPKAQDRKARKHAHIAEARLALADLVKERDAVRAVLWPEDEPDEIVE